MDFERVGEFGEGGGGGVGGEEGEDGGAGYAGEDGAVERGGDDIQACTHSPSDAHFSQGEVVRERKGNAPPSSRFTTIKKFIAPASVIFSPINHNTC